MFSCQCGDIPQQFGGVITVPPLQSVHIPLSQLDVLSLLPIEAEAEREVLPVLPRAAFSEAAHQDGLEVFRQGDAGGGGGGGRS